MSALVQRVYPRRTVLAAIRELSYSEFKSSTNVVKIRLCVDMFLQLLLYCEPVRGKAYKYMVICLGRKYPRVRKYAADQLYVQLLSDRVGVGKVTSDSLDAAAVEVLAQARVTIVCELSVV